MVPTAQALRPASVTPPIQWLQDPETGFIYASPRSKSIGIQFDLEKKKEFVALYKAMFPELMNVCEQVGISRQTFYNHLKLDPAFASVIKDIKESKADTLESAMFKNGQRPGGFMDRIAMLRAYRPALYMEKSLHLTSRDLEPSIAESKSRFLGTIIDAELVGDQGPRLSHPASSSPELAPSVQQPETVKESGDQG